MRRRVLGLVAFCVVVVVGRVAWDASRNHQDGLRFEAAGETHEAAVRYGRSIHMYLPLLPVGDRASERLVALAEAASARGDAVEARFCWEELRSGWLAVRSAWQPGRAWIAQAEDGIAALILTDDAGTWPARDLPPAAREAQIRAALEAREDPSTFWVLVMGLGWAVWLGAATAALWRGIPADDDAPVAWAVIGRWTLISAVGYGLWLLGLALA